MINPRFTGRMRLHDLKSDGTGVSAVRGGALRRLVGSVGIVILGAFDLYCKQTFDRVADLCTTRQDNVKYCRPNLNTEATA